MARPKKGEVPEHLKPFQWKKGQSGNPRGRPRGRLISEAYHKILSTKLPPGKDVDERIKKVLTDLVEEGATIAEFVALAQVKEAMDGKTYAASEISDRTEGKPKQTQEIVGPDEGPLQTIGLDLSKLGSDELREVVALMAKAEEGEGDSHGEEEEA